MILRLGLAAALSLLMVSCSGDEEKTTEPVAAEEGKVPDSPGDVGGEPAPEGGMADAGSPMDAAKAAAEKAKEDAAAAEAPATAATGSGEEMTVKAGALNVRKGPGTKHAVVRTMKKGEKVQSASCEKNWCKIGEGEYVSKKFLGK